MPTRASLWPYGTTVTASTRRPPVTATVWRDSVPAPPRSAGRCGCTARPAAARRSPFVCPYRPRGALHDPDHPGRRPSGRTGGPAGDAERGTGPGGGRGRVQRTAGGGAGGGTPARHRADGPANAGRLGRGVDRTDDGGGADLPGDRPDDVR